MPGDFNDDGSVDAADYVLWRANPATFGGSPAGYDLWLANFGNTAPSAAAGTSLGQGAAIPEPSSIALLVLGLATLACRAHGRGRCFGRLNRP